MSKVYSIDKSPLYRMRNRRKLANLLGLPDNYFSKYHEHEYREHSQLKADGVDKRYFYVPSDDLAAIQKRICRLMMRIETPDWVMSGKKKRSYITNAEYHVASNFVKTIDISQFYDSVKKQYIYRMFLDVFCMAHDIAWIITDLVTYKGVLPTGSPSSQLIAFWAYSEMFEKINRIAIAKDCQFTLYVDDMTFSSPVPIEKGLREDVTKLLRQYGLHSKKEKDHYYQADRMKVVTGVGIKNGEKLVLNRKRKELLDQYEKCKKSQNLYDIEKLKGMLSSQRQIEPDIFPEVANFIKHYETDLKKMAKDRYFRNIRKKSKAINHVIQV